VEDTRIRQEVEKMDIFHHEYTKYVEEMRALSNKNMLREFAEVRQMPIQEVINSDIFYINEPAEMLNPSYMHRLEDFGVISKTNKRPIFNGRYAIPIKNSYGQVINLVGYDKQADERYVYATSKYYQRRDTFYGLENMEYAIELGYAIITEGITDTIRVRSLGYKNCFARCGTHGSGVMDRQLNRLRYGVIKIPDRDSAGQRALQKWRCNRSIVLNTYIKYKDIDQMCVEEQNREIVKSYIDACIDWVTQREHRGYVTTEEIITML